MSASRKQRSISVRGVTYERLQQAAEERGMSIAQIVEACVADVRVSDEGSRSDVVSDHVPPSRG